MQCQAKVRFDNVLKPIYWFAAPKRYGSFPSTSRLVFGGNSTSVIPVGIILAFLVGLGFFFFFCILFPWRGSPCTQAGIDTWCRRARKGQRRPRQCFLGAVSHCIFPSYVAKLHLAIES